MADLRTHGLSSPAGNGGDFTTPPDHDGLCWARAVGYGRRGLTWELDTDEIRRRAAAHLGEGGCSCTTGKGR